MEMQLKMFSADVYCCIFFLTHFPTIHDNLLYLYTLVAYITNNMKQDQTFPKSTLISS